jgi:TonB-dependent receptor
MCFHKKINKFSILLALIILTPAFASSQNYSVNGIVRSSEDNESLPGATILIENSMYGTTSNMDGEFILKNIKAKTITLKVSYVGFQDKSIDIDFLSINNQKITVDLFPATTQLDQVQITEQADGQAKALIEQKDASNIKNVVSARQIQKFPDMNAAEALQRIPGITLQRDQGDGKYVMLRGTPPELTNFNINGEQIPSPEGGVRYVGMDVISADQIETIEVTKVLTPDMDGDGIGGNVNIITKKANSFIPQVSASIAGLYNNLRQSPGFQTQFSYGQRYNKFGFYLNASYYMNEQGSDDLEFRYAKGPFWGSQDEGEDNYHIQYKEFQLREYNITRKRTGVSATLDYQFNPKSFIYLKGMYNNYSDSEVRRRKIYDLDDAVSETLYLYGGLAHDVKDREKKQTIFTLNFGGEQQIKSTTVDYEVAYAVATENEPYHMEARFNNPGHAIQMKFDMSDPDWPRVTYPNAESAEYVDAYDQYELDPIFFSTSDAEDRNITAKFNYTIPYMQEKGKNGFIKFGAKTRFKEKTTDNTAQEYGAYFEESNIYPDIGPVLSLETVNAGFVNNNLLNQGYVIDYMPDPENMKNFFNYYSHLFIYDRTATKTKSYGEDYSADEKIYAAYLMAQQTFNRFLFLGGIRFEKTDVDYQGIYIQYDKGKFIGMDTLYDKRSHQFLLPQFQVRYAALENLNLRSALTYTYSRPNFDDVLPFRVEDFDKVTYGNPDLVYPTSMNVDFMAEYYLPKAQAFFSGGLFYKKIENFVFYYIRFAHEGDPKDYGLVEITKAINGNDADVFGSELNSQFKFWFLPNFFSNFGLYLNYTYTYSQAYINQRLPANYTDAVVIFGEDDLSLFSNDSIQEEIPLPGQSPHTANLSLFYESQRLYARFSANYHASFLYRLGADEDLDEYYDEAWHLDFNANYAITPNLRVFVDFINMTNAPLKYYLGTPDKVIKQEYYSWSCRFGVKIIF